MDIAELSDEAIKRLCHREREHDKRALISTRKNLHMLVDSRDKLNLLDSSRILALIDGQGKRKRMSDDISGEDAFRLLSRWSMIRRRMADRKETTPKKGTGCMAAERSGVCGKSWRGWGECDEAGAESMIVEPE